MSNDNFGGDIFNLDNESFVNQKKTKEVLYKPDADKGRGGVYESIVRFLPWWKNPNGSKIHKFYVWVVDPVNGAFSVDCPTSVGKKSILSDTYWKLKRSQSAADQQIADQCLSRAENFYSLVQIIADLNRPDLVGKIMVLKFGKKINEKIEAQLKPKKGSPCNAYDLFEGKDLALQVTKKQKWNNYDLCEFVGDKCAITLPGETEPLTKNSQNMEKVLGWLKEGSPDLAAYEYQEWSGEQHDKVLKAISNILPGGKMAEEILAATSKREPISKSYAEDVYTETESAETAAPAPQPTKASGGGKSSMDELYSGL